MRKKCQLQIHSLLRRKNQKHLTELLFLNVLHKRGLICNNPLAWPSMVRRSGDPFKVILLSEEVFSTLTFG